MYGFSLTLLGLSLLSLEVTLFMDMYRLVWGALEENVNRNERESLLWEPCMEKNMTKRWRREKEWERANDR